MTTAQENKTSIIRRILNMIPRPKPIIVQWFKGTVYHLRAVEYFAEDGRRTLRYIWCDEFDVPIERKSHYDIASAEMNFGSWIHVPGEITTEEILRNADW